MRFPHAPGMVRGLEDGCLVAKLRRLDGAREVVLTPRFMVGRSAACDLQLEESCVSGEHASIFFAAGCWLIRDLASRNGTRLNQDTLVRGSRRPLTSGDVVTFGGDVESWGFDEDGAPQSIEVQRLGIQETAQTTVELAESSLHFKVSPDEEHVSLSATSGPITRAVPARAFSYLLLTLARARLADHALDIAEGEQGWLHVDDLLPGLYAEVETLNLNTFRARKHFGQLGVRDSKDLVQRRAGSERIRLNVGDLHVERALAHSGGGTRDRSAR